MVTDAEKAAWSAKAEKTPASKDAAGLMSVEDKVKLDSIDAGAKPYELPIASKTTLGGVKIGGGLAVAADGLLSVTGASAE